jgi:hypothetical protein
MLMWRRAVRLRSEVSAFAVASADRRSPWRRLVRPARAAAIGAPSVLLIVVAAAQMTLARTAGLSPWKGGGFGMFASVDGLPFRWVRLYVSAADRSEELAVPPSLEDQAHRVVTWPHARAVQDLARAVIARERRLNRPVDRVRVEVWRAEVSQSLDVSEALVRQTTLAADEIDRRGDR